MFRSLRTFLMPATLALSTIGCIQDERLAGGTETETTLSGRVLDQDLGPAPGVDVILLPQAYDPGTLEPGHPVSVHTDADGRYAFTGIPQGAYNILARDRARTLGALVQDVEVHSDSEGARPPLPDAILKATGTLSVPWMRLPFAAGRVFLPGTPFMNSFAKKGTAPGLLLAGVPEGRYASVLAQDADHSPVLNLVREPVLLKSGETVELPADPALAHTLRLVLNTTPAGADVAVDVVQYPLLVRLDSSFFDFSRTRADGADIRFTKPDGTPLAYQVDHWDMAAGDAAVWVRMDTVYGNRDNQGIVLQYGNASAPDRSDGPSVFSPVAGFAGVWHMGDTMPDAIPAARHDASGLGLEGTNHGARADSAGAVGGAAFFDGTGEHIDLQASSGFIAIGNQPITLSCWFLPRDSAKADGRLIDVHRADTNGSTLAMGYGMGGKVFYYSYLDNGFHPASAPSAPYAWHLAAVTFDGKDFRLYVDGSLALGPIAGGLMAGGGYRAQIGRFGDNPPNGFAGGIDEARIAKTARTAAWIKLDYESQRRSQRLIRGLP